MLAWLAWPGVAPCFACVCVCVCVCVTQAFLPRGPCKLAGVTLLPWAFSLRQALQGLRAFSMEPQRETLACVAACERRCLPCLHRPSLACLLACLPACLLACVAGLESLSVRRCSLAGLACLSAGLFRGTSACDPCRQASSTLLTRAAFLVSCRRELSATHTRVNAVWLAHGPARGRF